MQFAVEVKSPKLPEHLTVSAIAQLKLRLSRCEGKQLLCRCAGGWGWTLSGCAWHCWSGVGGIWSSLSGVEYTLSRCTWHLLKTCWSPRVWPALCLHMSPVCNP